MATEQVQHDYILTSKDLKRLGIKGHIVRVGHIGVEYGNAHELLKINNKQSHGGIKISTVEDIQVNVS